nr:hypothetical protein [uncultured Undibacterium sp.]
MRIEQFVVAHFAEQLANETVERVIQILHSTKDGMTSGDDSGLQSFWEEICVQVQGEESSYFESQMSLIEHEIETQLKRLPRAELLALWLETIDGSIWRDENLEERDGHEIAQICLNDIVIEIHEIVLNRATNFESDSINRFLHSTVDSEYGDEEDEYEDEHNSEVEVETDDTDEQAALSSPHFDGLTIIISHEDILDLNIAPTLDELNGLIESPSEAREWFENVDIVIDGYNETTEELFEIMDVRNFIQKLDEAFPFWLFFLSKRHLGLQCISLCFLPPYLTDAAKLNIFPVRLDELLSNRWFPAMNQICSWTEMSEGEVESLIKRSVSYLLDGPNSECIN